MDARLPESVSRSLLRLRAAGYMVALPALAVAWLIERSPQLAVLAGAVTLTIIWNTIRLPKAGPVWALAVDLTGAGLIWWMYGPVPPVYFVLAYVLVVAAIVLQRRQALTVIAATVALILGMGAAHMLAAGSTLPFFHEATETLIDRLGEFVLPLIIVLYTALIMLTISGALDASQAALRESEQRLRLSFDRAATGMVTFHLEGTLAEVNPAFCSQVGYEEDELLRMSWRDLVAEPDRAAAESRLAGALSGGTDHWRAEDRLLRSDGSMFWASIVVTLIRNEQGLPQYFAQVLDISERKAAETALAESEERYRTLFEGIPAALYRTTPDGRILDANTALVELLGYPSREALLEIDVRGAYVEEAKRDNLVDKLTREGPAIDFEAQLRKADGSTIWIRDSSRVVLGENGEVAYFEGALVDTTERHMAEAALQESEARLRAVFEHAPIGIVTVNLDHRIVAANVELTRILGRSVEELRTMHIRDLTHPDDRHLDDDSIRQLLAGEIPFYRLSKRYLHADGHAVWIELAVTAVRDDAGRPELLIGLIRDVTEQRAAQVDRDNMIRILEATPDFVTILDVQGHPTYANRAASDFYGLSSRESLAHLNISELIETSSKESVADIFQALRASGSWTGDVTLHSPSGFSLPGSAVVLAHTDEHGMITHISASFRDLSERIETHKRLKRLVRSKDEFIASISHELRTPLTAVVGLAQELKGSWRVFSSDEIDEFVGLVADQASDVANLIEDLLVAARADIGKVTVAPRVVNLASQIDGVLAAFDKASQRRVEVVADSVDVWADPARLRQVIRNLVTNAIRYGGRHIKLHTAVSDGFVALHVSDDGPGISPGLEESIFEPYARDHEPGSQPNSVGLGLTVSRHLARLMGGDLVYTRGERTMFTLTLPQPAQQPAQAL